MKTKYLSQIVLLKPSIDDWSALAADPEKGCESLGIMCSGVNDVLAGAAAQTRQFLQKRNLVKSEWGCFLAIDKRTSQVVGTCGYKGPPDSTGAVEAAVYTFPPFEGLGCATLMAGELICNAAARPGVNMVVANTLPKENASTKVLRRCGFDLRGEASDPEDGKVWRWEFPIDRRRDPLEQ